MVAILARNAGFEFTPERCELLAPQLAWLLVPVLGFLLAATAITAIYYGLSSLEKWNTTHNPQQLDAPAGQTNWLVIGAVVFSVLMGTTALMSSIAFSFQRYFEYQIEEARKISQ